MRGARSGSALTGECVQGRAWAASAASRDLALLQLASALGGGVRPILLAASRADCEPPPGVTCQLVRTL